MKNLKGEEIKREINSCSIVKSRDVDDIRGRGEYEDVRESEGEQNAGRLEGVRMAGGGGVGGVGGM